MYTALRATSLTLAGYLRGSLESDPDLGALFKDGTKSVSLATPQEMGGSSDSQEGLSVWLYRIARDDQRLNAPPVRPQPGLLRRTPLPIRAHYLMTPMITSEGNSPETEHAILGKVLQALHDRPQLRGSDLKDSLAGTDSEISVRLEPLDLEGITRVWEALDRPYQLSVSYEVSVVLIESARPAEPVSPVSVVQPEYAQILDSEPI